MTKISTDPPAFRVRPAQPEEAGAFFAQTPEQDAQMGALARPYGFRRKRKSFGTPGIRADVEEFKAELQQVVDKLRETVLKDLSSMRHFAMKTAAKYRAAGHRIMATS